MNFKVGDKVAYKTDLKYKGIIFDVKDGMTWHKSIGVKWDNMANLKRYYQAYKLIHYDDPVDILKEML